MYTILWNPIIIPLYHIIIPSKGSSLVKSGRHPPAPASPGCTAAPVWSFPSRWSLEWWTPRSWLGLTRHVGGTTTWALKNPSWKTMEEIEISWKSPNFDVCNFATSIFPQNGPKWVEMGRNHVDIPIHPAPSFGTWFSATVSIISFQHHHGSLMISAKPNNVSRRNSATKKRVCCELYKPIKSSLDWSSRHPVWWGLNQSHINAGIAQFQMMQHCFGWKNGSSCPCFAFYCPPCPPPPTATRNVYSAR